MTPVALLIFIATIGLSLYTMYSNQSLYEEWLLSPWRVVHQKKWYLMITSGFLHADLTHLIFNMLTFFFFAFKLESIVGGISFFVIYFGSMILSDVSTVRKHKDNPHYRAVGASGAISGVLFSFILFAPGANLYMMLLPIPIPAPVFALLYLVYCYYASKRSQDFINHEAHLWGALSGLVLTILLEPGVVPYFFSEVFG